MRLLLSGTALGSTAPPGQGWRGHLNPAPALSSQETEARGSLAGCFLGQGRSVRGTALVVPGVQPACIECLMYVSPEAGCREVE